MDDEPAPVFAPRIKESLLQRMQDNLFVPIGAILTVGCYAVGLKSLVDGRSMLGQKMMYCRCLFQGVAVSAMFFDQFTRKSKSDR